MRLALSDDSTTGSDENRKAHIHIQSVICDTLGMDPDAAVGQRVAELRKQKALRQDEFLALLAARGVDWTQTTLSRVEGGKRALKATEAFAVADALGVEVSQLNPAAGGLYYEIQSHRLKYREATAAARRAIGSARRVRAEGLVALNLANEIQSGRTCIHSPRHAPHVHQRAKQIVVPARRRCVSHRRR